MDYLLKSSAIILLFYGFYKFILQRETFFQLNRLFLIIGIITALIIPFIVIPIYVEISETNLQELVFTETSNTVLGGNSINWLEVTTILYISGVILLSGKLLFNFLSLGRLIANHSKTKKENYNYIETHKNTSPFSFFNYIVINPIKYKKKELEQIITHEKVHVNQLHSIDILISQIATILFWFNPFIWFYKKEIEQNLEFIADDLAQQKTDCERSYQKLLLKSSLPENKLALTNNFYNSLIKKRIIMLHKNRSKNTSQWKYLLILPLITAFIFTFNTKAIAQNSSTDKKQEITVEEKIDMVVITKDTKESELKQIKKDFLNDGVTVNFKKIKRNKDGEITQIGIDLKSKTSNATYSMNADGPINPITISSNNNGENLSIGNAKSKNHKNDYFFVSKDGEHKIYSNGKGKKHVILTEDHNDEGNVFVVKESNGDGKSVIIEIEDDEDSEDGDNDVKWVTEEENSTKVEIIKKKGGKEKNVFISKLDDEAIYFIDGKKSSKEKMEKLNTSVIKSVNVLKGDSAEKKYGKKARNGVIEITTKEK